MGKLPNTPKTGGRQKGTPNKRTALMADLLESQGICLVDIILMIVPVLEPNKQVDVLMGLLPYVYPKRREHVYE
jgi:hypothetical protein